MILGRGATYVYVSSSEKLGHETPEDADVFAYGFH